MSTTTSAPPARTYGGIRQRTSPGIGPLKLIPSIGLMTGFAGCMMLSMRLGFLKAALLTGLYAAAFVPVVIYRRGRPLYVTFFHRYRFARSVRKGHNIYRAGVVGVHSRRSLPGILAPVHVWNCEADGLGRPYALIQIPGARHWAVMFRVDPEGGTLVSPETRDQRVAQWGELLATVGQAGGVRQVAAVIETRPNGGALLRAHVRRIVSAAAPQFARDAMEASARELPTGLASTSGYVAVVYSEAQMQISGGKPAERAQAAADDIGRRMPELGSVIAASGASRPRPMTGRQLARWISETYNPATILDNAEDEASGNPPDVAWEDCGPAAHDEDGTAYWHDSALSRVWEVIKPPRGVFTDRQLERIAGPVLDAPNKRVTLLYHPVDAADAGEVLDRDVRTALNRQNRRKGPVHAHDAAGVEIAQQAAREEANGAGVTALSVLIVGTAVGGDETGECDLADLKGVSTAIERASRSARLKVQPVYGGQAAAFAASFGFLSLPDLSTVPDALRANI